MSKLRIKLIKSGLYALLNCDAVTVRCDTLAGQLAGRCGTGYASAPPHYTGQRVAVNVYPASKEASADNIQNDTLRRTVQSMEILL